MQAATSFCGVWPQLFSGLVSGPGRRGRVFFSAVLFVWNKKDGSAAMVGQPAARFDHPKHAYRQCAAQPLELCLCKAVYYFFLGEYDMPSAGISTLQACATMQKTACTVPS